ISVAFDDVNEDGEPDIFACIGTTNDIEVYLNQGSGNFNFDSAYSVGGTPKEVVFADFNGDTHADMAATSNNTDQAGVLLSRMSLILSVDDVTNEGNLPIRFALGQNYPNPFNPETHIRFSLPEASQVKVEVFNTLGQSVMVLVDEYLSAGDKEITWNGVNASGRKVASGVYLYRLTTNRFTDSKSMVLLN
ncbi:MAG TPA: FG-GAP-like repeat-containing protein, partial [candidate division Zixibacteria bacterium]|nr:FG-GAP-like repeat-containing protein [candidate division Zixibacteria bacterium]